MPFDLSFESNTSFLLCGPSGCGKTTFTLELIKYKHYIFNKAPNYVVVVRKHQQPTYDEMFKNGLINEIYSDVPSLHDIVEMAKKYMHIGGSLLVLDDVMTDVAEDIQTIFTEICHHYNLTCLLLSQNLFFNSPQFRTIRMNSSYLVVFKNPANKAQIQNLARLYNPTKPAYLIDSFMDATSISHSYLLLDYRQKTNDLVRIRSKLLPNEMPITVYIPN